MEGEGSSDMELTDIQTSADCFDGSVIFHVIKDVLGFVLYMHQQIPSILQDVSLEYDTLHSEFKELEMALKQTEVKASFRRKQTSRMREVKRGIRRMEKLMNAVSSLQTALQLLVTEFPNIQEVILIFGASPIRPQHVYEMCFSHGKGPPKGTHDFAKSRVADGLSRKAIRALVSKGAGSSSYPGPTKLFLLVKAPPFFNLPLHFLPKRDFKHNRKVVPFRLQFKCRNQDLRRDATDYVSEPGVSFGFTESTSSDLIWFQCRHVIKGMESKTPTEE